MGRAAYKGFRRRRGAARLVLSSSFSPSLSLRVVSVCVWVAAVGFGWGLGGACSCAVGLGRFGVGPVRALRVVIVMGLFFFLPSLSFLSHPFPAPHAPPPAAFATSAESPRRRLGVRVSIACGVSKRGFPFRFFSFGAKEPSRDRVLFVNREHANTTIRAHVWATAHGQPQPHRNSDASAHPVRLTYQALTIRS